MKKIRIWSATTSTLISVSALITTPALLTSCNNNLFKTVNTNYGKVKGRNTNENTTEFYSVPYGAPPVNSLRFRAPIHPSKWKNTIDCTVPKNDAAMQFPSSGDNIPFSQQNENCLNLNIYAPKIKSSQKLPVFVYVHGGEFHFGTKNQDDYNGNFFAKTNNCIVVVPEYRLNIFGFFAASNSWQDMGNNQKTNGNWGLLDILLSLEWVHENISAFGGDANCVTAAGCSAGSVIISSLMISPAAQKDVLGYDLFKNALLESGNIYSLNTFGVATEGGNPNISTEHGDRFELLMGESQGTTSFSLTQMQQYDAKQLLHKVEDFDYDSSFLSVFVPCWDGFALPSYENRYSVIKDGKFMKNVNVMFSYNTDESHFNVSPSDTDMSSLPEAEQEEGRLELIATYELLISGVYGVDAVSDLTANWDITNYTARDGDITNEWYQWCLKLRQFIACTAYIGSNVYFVNEILQYQKANNLRTGKVYAFNFDYWYNGFVPSHALEMDFYLGTYQYLPQVMWWNDDQLNNAATMGNIMREYVNNFMVNGNPNDSSLANWTNIDNIDNSTQSMWFSSEESENTINIQTKKLFDLDNIILALPYYTD